MNAQKYIETLEDLLWQVIVRHFPNENYIYQDDNVPVYRARVVANYKVQNNTVKSGLLSRPVILRSR